MRPVSRCRPSTSAAAAVVVVLALAGTAAAREAGVSADIAALNPCLYGDCEARGAYAADPYGWSNPATPPVGILPWVPRGLIVSPSYFRLNVGGVAADIESLTVGAVASPFVLMATAVYAEAAGTARSLPGVHLRLRAPILRLTAAVDLERAAGVRGLALGLMGEVPGLVSDLRARLPGGLVVDSSEDHEINLTLGAHWRGGRRDWFMAGAFLNPVANRSTLEVGRFRERATLNAWFVRGGLSLLPFVPLGLADGAGARAEWLGEVRLGMDVEHRNVSAPGDGSRIDTTGYFGVDVRLLPDGWNPLSRWVRFVLVTGVDTGGGWGVGGGINGNGPLQMVSCNPAYSSRPRAPSLGDRVDTWSATCGFVWPF